MRRWVSLLAIGVTGGDRKSPPPAGASGGDGSATGLGGAPPPSACGPSLGRGTSLPSAAGVGGARCCWCFPCCRACPTAAAATKTPDSGFFLQTGPGAKDCQRAALAWMKHNASFEFLHTVARGHWSTKITTRSEVNVTLARQCCSPDDVTAVNGVPG